MVLEIQFSWNTQILTQIVKSNADFDLNNEHNMVIFYKKLKKYNEIQLTKNKIDLIIR